MYQVNIEKRFVSGFLQGLTASETIRFANHNEAYKYAQWAKTHKEEPVTPCAGLSQYVIDSFTTERVLNVASN
jgi:hypothetical protein